MVIRTALLEGTFPSLDQMDGFMSGPPGGNTRYVFGQSFLSYVADNSSDDAITRWNSSYGGWWLPYLLPAERAGNAILRSHFFYYGIITDDA